MRIDPNELPKHIRESNEEKDQAKQNTVIAIMRGLRMLAFSVARILAEAWVVQLIWNNVSIEIMPVYEISYWHSLLLLLMVRIILGQFKITFYIKQESK